MPANTQDPREHVRSNVFLSAVLAQGAQSKPVRVRNISAMGALLDGTALPGAGTAVRLRRGNLCITGQVAWLDKSLCGVRFDQPIDVEPWVRRVEHLGQRRVDHVVAAWRTGGAIPSETEPAISNIGRLDEISAELTRLSIEFADFPGLTVELAERLLKLDAVAQRLRNWVSNAA